MGVATDKSLQGLTTAVTNISATGMSDTTGQAIVSAINGLSGAISPAASNVSFDNTGTGMTASNAHDAIIEVNNKVGSGTFKISDHYTATTSQYGSINLSSVIGKSVNQCSVFNVLAYSSAYPDGLFCYLTFIGSNYFIIVRNGANTLVANTSVDLYINYYTV